jgi:hypothetical protein
VVLWYLVPLMVSALAISLDMVSAMQPTLRAEVSQ